MVKVSYQSTKHIKTILKMSVIKLNIKEDINLHKVMIIMILLGLIVKCDLIDTVINQLVICIFLDSLGAHFGKSLTKKFQKR